MIAIFGSREDPGRFRQSRVAGLAAAYQSRDFRIAKISLNNTFSTAIDDRITVLAVSNEIFHASKSLWL